jgi:RHS repeat-associated protein
VKNLQGDVVKILNASGSVVANYYYDAWGKVTTSSSIGQTNPIRYRGYYYDTDTGFYYLQSRYYDPAIKRFISADSYINANGDLLGFNMYAYCGNKPTVRKDTQGYAAETVFDFISLGFSIADVIANPANPWAWAGLVGDIVDVAIPFVGGVGEVIKGVGTIDKTTDVVKAAKKAKSVVSDSVGTYEIVYKSGKNYVGKGTFDRAITSAMDHAKKIDLNDGMGDEVVSITWKRAKDSREAFMTEYMWQHRGSGVLSANKNANTYNKIWSPGKGYLGWD